MSSDSCLLIRINGPLQSWGTESSFSLRKTRLIPSRSAIAGLCCASLGLPRGSREEAEFLKEFASVRMRAMATRKRKYRSGQFGSVADSFFQNVRNGQDEFLPVRRLSDYHTVMGTVHSESRKENKDAVLTFREYLQDAKSFVLLEGDNSLIERISKALEDPVWGVFLGRKSCIPSEPVFVGLFPSEREVCSYLENAKEVIFITEEDAANFADSTDLINDVPMNFSSVRRSFGRRRVTRRSAD